MYIFGRSRAINQERFRDAAVNAVEAGSRASALTGLPIFTWSAVLGPDVGTVTWSTRVDHLDELMTADDAMASSDEFTQWVTGSADLYTGSSSDVVSEIIAAPPTDAPAPFVMVIRGVAAHGMIGEALEVGVELAETAMRIGGNHTSFVAPLVGPYGAVGWLTQYPDLAALESEQAALQTDGEWIKLVDRAGPAFQPGINGSLLRRLS